MKMLYFNSLKRTISEHHEHPLPNCETLIHGLGFQLCKKNTGQWMKRFCYMKTFTRECAHKDGQLNPTFKYAFGVS
jgi:hypothetical protein